MTYRVRCSRCGWRSNRAWAYCECDGEYGCRCGTGDGFGRCRKCHAEMRTPRDIQAEREWDQSFSAKENPS